MNWHMTLTHAHIDYALLMAFTLWDVGFYLLIRSAPLRLQESPPREYP